MEGIRQGFEEKMSIAQGILGRYANALDFIVHVCMYVCMFVCVLPIGLANDVSLCNIDASHVRHVPKEDVEMVKARIKGLEDEAGSPTSSPLISCA